MLLDTIQQLVGLLLGGTLWTSHMRTLCLCICGLLIGGRASVQHIGENMPNDGVDDRHNIKRASRFVNNQLLQLSRAQRRLLWRVTEPHDAIVVALDWTEKIGRWSVLMSAIIARGRAIPVWWTVNDKDEARAASVEPSHLQGLLQMLPPAKKVILLADRGFDTSGFLHLLLLQERLSFVTRFAAGISVQPLGAQAGIMIEDTDLLPDVPTDLGWVLYTKVSPVWVRVVRMHDRRQAEPWNLATNLDLPADKIVRLYARRFSIEELFRDLKDGGWGLDRTKLQAKALEVMLFIVMVAYVISMAVGVHVEESQNYKGYQAQSGKRALSLFRLGRKALLKSKHLPTDLADLPFHRVAPPITDLLSLPWSNPKPLASEKPRLLPSALEAYMKKFGYSQVGLAGLIGVGQPSISRAILGRFPIPRAWIGALARAHGLSREQMLAFNSIQPPPKQSEAPRERPAGPPPEKKCEWSIPPDFIALVKQARLRQIELATALGISQPTVSRILDGTQRPTQTCRDRIRQWAKLPPETLRENVLNHTSGPAY